MSSSKLEKNKTHISRMQRRKLGKVRKSLGQQLHFLGMLHSSLQTVWRSLWLRKPCTGFPLLHLFLCTVSVYRASLQLVCKYQINTCFYSTPSLDILFNECSLCKTQELWEHIIKNNSVLSTRQDLHGTHRWQTGPKQEQCLATESSRPRHGSSPLPWHKWV